MFFHPTMAVIPFMCKRVAPAPRSRRCCTPTPHSRYRGSCGWERRRKTEDGWQWFRCELFIIVWNRTQTCFGFWHLTCIPLRVFMMGMAFRNSGSHWSLFIAEHRDTIREDSDHPGQAPPNVIWCYYSTRVQRMQAEWLAFTYFLITKSVPLCCTPLIQTEKGRTFHSFKPESPASLTQLLLGVLEGLLEAGESVRWAEFKDEGAFSWDCGKLQLCWQERHTEGQRLLLWQLFVHRCH